MKKMAAVNAKFVSVFISVSSFEISLFIGPKGESTGARNIKTSQVKQHFFLWSANTQQKKRFFLIRKFRYRVSR